jgi:hypothetical protein
MRCLILAQLAGLLVAVGQGHAAPDLTKIYPEAGCATNPAVVGPCFAVRGRAAVGNGTPSFKIVQAGTSRIFGVLPAESEIVPACLAKAVTFESEVTAEFRVCPFTAAKEGQMQMVCVDSVGEFTVRRWDDKKRAHVVGGRTPGCAVPTPTLDPRWREELPADVVDLVERYSGCIHFGGEEGYDEARRKEIADSVAQLKCDRLDKDQQELRKKYAHKRRVLRVVNAASAYDASEAQK